MGGSRGIGVLALPYALYSTKCVEEAFSEGHIQDTAYSTFIGPGKDV
jgi:hypothetical protein